MPAQRNLMSKPRAADRPRCPWAGDDAQMQRYHDREWGVPLHDDRGLFEFLVLEGAQAGLSWRTVLNKRDNYRRAFAGFDIAACAALDDAAIEAFLGDAGLIRNRQKLFSARDNARAALAVIAEHGSLDAWLWSLVGGKPQVNAWRDARDVPASTEVSERMSRTLRKQGFRFVGPTICYAFMQATGMVNDHLLGCHKKSRPTAATTVPRPRSGRGGDRSRTRTVG